MGSLFTALALVITLMVVPVHAEDTVITLDSSRSEALNVAAGEVVTLNLNGNTMSGKIVNNGTLTITGNGKISVTGDHAITNSGTLTINGGTVDVLTHGKAAVYNNLGATATINGGTFFRSQEAGVQGSNGGNSWYTIFNQGVMKITGGTFENKGDFSSMIENGWASGGPGNGVVSDLTITGGKFTSGMHALKNDSYGKLNISGGEFRAVMSGSALLNWNEATISGGTFTSDKTSAVLSVKDRAGIESGVLNVSGGTFNSNANANCFTNPVGYTFSTPTITGGSYSGALGATVAKEYKIVTESGRNVVKAKVPAITLTETKVGVAMGTTRTLLANRVDAIEGDIEWISSNTSVATVNDGVVTPVANGKVNITAKADGKEAICEVQVYTTAQPSLPTPPANTGKDTTIEVNNKTSQTLTNTLSDVIANVNTTTAVSAETKQKLSDALAAGETITVEATTDVLDAKKVDKEIIKKVEAIIAKDANVAQYFDLSMMLNGSTTGELGTLNELTSKASFTVNVSKDLVKTGRTFYMVRIHDGKAEKIQGSLKGNDFTFETDKFSIYALVYEDAKTVDTGDTTNTTSFVMMMGAAAFILGGLLLKRRFEK